MEGEEPGRRTGESQLQGQGGRGERIDGWVGGSSSWRGGTEDGVGRGGAGWGWNDAPPLRVLSVRLVQQGRGVAGDGHGRALDHGAGRRPRRHPLGLLAALRLLLLQPLLRHLAPVHGGGVAAAGPAGREGGGRERSEPGDFSAI